MQSIKEKLNKIKIKGDRLIENNQFFNLILIILIAFSSFGLGRLSYLEEKQTPITLITENLKNQNLASINSSQQLGSMASKSITNKPLLSTGKYVASKNSKLYHAPWCSGAQRIKDENKIWFQTKEEAEASGRTPASNCKGI